MGVVFFFAISTHGMFASSLRYIALIGVVHGKEKCTVATFLQDRISGEHYESANH